MLDLLEGLPIDHQYGRQPAVVRPDEPVRLLVQVDPGYREVEVMASVTPGPIGPEELAQVGERHRSRGDGPTWLVELPAMPEGAVVHYLVRATDSRDRIWYADGRRPLGAATVFCHRVTARRPPEWARRGVMYQIFVDRFSAPGDPALRPGPGHWAGGNLHGVRRAVPYLADLGVTIVWLTPVFACTSYHGYDVEDLRSVDPRFGGDRALADLVEAAHRAGLRVVLDLVPNHLSHRHPWFQEALSGGPKRDWFFFRRDGYDTFFGSRGLPKLNLDHPAARRAMIEAARYWLDRFGVDGYRIDHVLGPSESFLAALAAELNAAHPDAWLFGEATASAAFIRRFGGLLDGATDFPTAYALRDLLAGEIDPSDFREVEQEAPGVLSHQDFTWVRFVDNHDMDRALSAWGGDPAKLEAGVEMLLGLGGTPCLLYGTEQGLMNRPAGDGLEAVRVPMNYRDGLGVFVKTRALVRERSAWREQEPWPGVRFRYVPPCSGAGC
ncbi:MAG: alpha-amylase family glycosyl hydrolase [Acidimicrobiia bacterium]